MKIVALQDNTGLAPSDSLWHAFDDDTFDGTGPIGYGETEAEAIADLKEKIGGGA